MTDLWVCVTSIGSIETNVYGTFVRKEDAEEFAKTLSTDPEGDVNIVLLQRERALWHPTHYKGHEMIGGGTNPACPYCQEEESENG